MTLQRPSCEGLLFSHKEEKHLTNERYLFFRISDRRSPRQGVADQISDGVLDAILKDDPMGRVAHEVLCTTGMVMVAGEITTQTYVDIPKIARDIVKEIGYTRAKYGFDGDVCAVITAIDEQSEDIRRGWTRLSRSGNISCPRKNADRRGRPGERDDRVCLQ